MSIIKEKLTEAIEAKKNDINSYIWKFARNKDKVQPEIKLMDATPEQLQYFYKHCKSMLYNTDKFNIGRYPLLDLIKEQRDKCNIELFIRKVELGSISADGQGYSKVMYCQNLLEFKRKNYKYFMDHDFDSSPISLVVGKLPREFEDITIGSVIKACLGQLGVFSTRHITTSFILSIGVFLTPKELQECNEYDENGKKISKLTVLKKKLGLKQSYSINVKSGGLTLSQLRAMLNLRTKNYSELSTEQLTTLRDKVLFHLEKGVLSHVDQWENKLKEIEKVAEVRNITLE